ncbi:urease accessory protein UreD [Photobacterium sp. SDRW27]|uniref:urease accessory protein UreD n=1 Tax=Photobacterium obscurum TaxID=2829490 RepID=UPI002244DEE0|nr:urease accessory protein UreD [Photobacterium obscurum]MCW8330190.1 urease accessory protein UreD [Photobacterium obscurum]
MTMMHKRSPLTSRTIFPLDGITAVTPKPTAGELENDQGWRAQLELGFSNSSSTLSKTILKHRKQLGPLAVQRPLYPEGDICHTYLLHPPGGVVGGDKLLIMARCESSANALITTPGATKFYRTTGKFAYQKQQLSVENGAALEWLPQENIYFPEARVRMDTEINVEPGGRFIGWEMHCFGRPALKEGFNKGSVIGCTQLRIGNELLLAEQLNVQGGDQHQQNAGLRDYSMLATMIVTDSSEPLLNMVQTLLCDYQEYLLENNVVAGISEIGDINDENKVFVVRAMGNGTEPIMALFSQVWLSVRKHWSGRTPNPPRIWAT